MRKMFKTIGEFLGFIKKKEDYKTNSDKIYNEFDSEDGLDGKGLSIHPSIFNKNLLERVISDDDFPKMPSKFYIILHNNIYVGCYENLNQISNDYVDLKNSTLYKNFLKDSNLTRTYTKDKYTVIECQKS